ncbi:MAG: TMEM165/GDT1 family protein [Thermaurantiacus sp.]
MAAPLETALIAMGTVFAGEMGDKSQLLAIVLAARFRQPAAVIAGMATGLLLNHMLAAAVGVLAHQLIPADILRIVVAAGFFAAAALVLWRGEGREDPVQAPATWRGAYLTTAAAFFVVEMGDRTQLVVASMAAATGQPLAVLAGAFAGIMLATVPAVIFADRLLTRLPMRVLRWLSAAMFLVVGLWVLMG